MLKRLVNMLAINTSVNVDRNHKYLTFIEYLLTAHYCAKCVPWIAVFIPRDIPAEHAFSFSASHSCGVKAWRG